MCMCVYLYKSYELVEEARELKIALSKKQELSERQPKHRTLNYKIFYDTFTN